MTFQFIVEYIDLKEEGLPFNFNYSDPEYGGYIRYSYIRHRLIHSKRVRAKNGEQAIKIFQQKYPGYEVIGWR